MKLGTLKRIIETLPLDTPVYTIINTKVCKYTGYVTNSYCGNTVVQFIVRPQDRFAAPPAVANILAMSESDDTDMNVSNYKHVYDITRVSVKQKNGKVSGVFIHSTNISLVKRLHKLYNYIKK